MAAVVRNVSISPVKCLSRHGPMESAQGAGRGETAEEKREGGEARWWRGEVEETCCAVSGAGVLQLTNIRFMHFSSLLVLHLTFLMSRGGDTFHDKFWTVRGQIGL